MVTLSFADVLVLFSCFGGLAGVIYFAGKLSARVDSLEEWRRSMPQELGAIHAAIRDVDKMIRGEVT
jgi:hypothetical protein